MATAQQERERQLQREVARIVEGSVPGVEVLALELTGKERFCVFVDHPQGVDHALCARVTTVLRDYLDRYTVEVSSPGFDRPLRTQAHFERALGQDGQAAVAIPGPVESPQELGLREDGQPDTAASATRPDATRAAPTPTRKPQAGAWARRMPGSRHLLRPAAGEASIQPTTWLPTSTTSRSPLVATTAMSPQPAARTTAAQATP